MSENNLHQHKFYCRQNKPMISFFDDSRTCRFTARSKKSATLACISFDLETAKIESPVSFGPKSEDIHSLKPVAIAWQVKYLLHPELHPPLLPRAFVGENCVARFLAYMQFTSFYVQSVLRESYRPMAPLSDEDKIGMASANVCANCGKSMFLSQAKKHHCDLRYLKPEFV